MSNELKVRYSDEDLLEFREIVEAKLKMAQDELHTTEQQIADLNENGFNQQGGDWYDDSTAHTDLEMLQRLLQRQQRHVQDLKNALLRIQNKTYGICIVTGQLISKERLRLVPHATKSIDGKNIANAGRDVKTRKNLLQHDRYPTRYGLVVAKSPLRAAAKTGKWITSLSKTPVISAESSMKMKTEACVQRMYSRG
jgi:RNA polymerase-binding transcription factor DksA